MNKYFSTFSGIGAPEVTLEKLGLECVGYSEIDKYAIQIYQKHFPKHKNYGDITKIKTEQLQGLPIGYTDCLPKTKRFDVIGNAFNVDVVAHILKFIPK